MTYQTPVDTCKACTFTSGMLGLVSTPSVRSETWSRHVCTVCGSPGELASATVSFTALHSEINVGPPEFSLTCLSVGGSATAVSWQRDSQIIEEDSAHQTSQILILTTQDTQYENSLRVTGREAGQYRCTVSSNRDEFFGTTGSTVTSDVFTVLGEFLSVSRYL